jgi:probable HAF family extracellular repeat protein
MPSTRHWAAAASYFLLIALLACGDDPTRPPSARTSEPRPVVVANLAPVMSTLIGNAYDIPSFGYGATFTPTIGASGNIAGHMIVDANNTVHAAYWSPATGLTDVGTPSGCSYAFVSGINAQDQIVGWAGGCPTPNTAPQAYNDTWAYRWSPGTGFEQLAPPPSEYIVHTALALAINDAGVVAGMSEAPNIPWAMPARWDAAGTVEIASFANQYDFVGVSQAMVINDAGQIAGTLSRTLSGSGVSATVGFFWQPGSPIREIGSLGGNQTYVTGINSHGTVVGEAVATNGELHAFRWTPPGGMEDLGTLGGVQAWVVGVADNESIAGWSYLDAQVDQRAFRWTPQDGMQDLGLLPGSPTGYVAFSAANSISSAGIISGTAGVVDDAVGATNHAFRWTAEHGYEDLGVLSGGNTQGMSVNDNGEVAGFYLKTNSNGVADYHWARWNARTSETQTATLALSGLAQVYDGTPKTVTVTTTPPDLSGVTVVYSQGGAAVVAPVEAGSYDVVASLDNPQYRAPNATGVLEISRASQVIDFPAIPDQNLVAASISLSASGGASGNPVIFTSATTSICDVSATTVTLKAVGQCTILANQAGSANYEPAATVSRSFLVTYTSSGFLSPIGGDDELISAKAGTSIPIKFSLGGDYGLAVLATGSPYSVTIACASSEAIGVPDETSTVGKTGLQYDPITDEYTYVWKTLKSWSGQCRMLTLKLRDGTTYQARFEFK